MCPCAVAFQYDHEFVFFPLPFVSTAQPFHVSMLTEDILTQRCMGKRQKAKADRQLWASCSFCVNPLLNILQMFDQKSEIVGTRNYPDSCLATCVAALNKNSEVLGSCCPPVLCMNL